MYSKPKFNSTSGNLSVAFCKVCTKKYTYGKGILHPFDVEWNKLDQYIRFEISFNGWNEYTNQMIYIYIYKY